MLRSIRPRYIGRELSPGSNACGTCVKLQPPVPAFGSKIHTTSKREPSHFCGQVVVLPKMRFPISGIA